MSSQEFAITCDAERLQGEDIPCVSLREVIAMEAAIGLITEVNTAFYFPAWPFGSGPKLSETKPRVVAHYLVGCEDKSETKSQVAKMQEIPRDNVGKWYEVLSWFKGDPFFYPLDPAKLQQYIEEMCNEIEDRRMSVIGAEKLGHIIGESAIRSLVSHSRDIFQDDVDWGEVVDRKFRFLAKWMKSDRGLDAHGNLVNEGEGSVPQAVVQNLIVWELTLFWLKLSKEFKDKYLKYAGGPFDPYRLVTTE